MRYRELFVEGSPLTTPAPKAGRCRSWTRPFSRLAVLNIVHHSVFFFVTQRDLFASPRLGVRAVGGSGQVEGEILHSSNS